MSQKPFPPPYDVLTLLLVAARCTAGITQAELAERLLIGQSAVSKVERGVQRLDMVELHRWLSAIGDQSIAEFAAEFDRRVRAQTTAARRWGRTRHAAAKTTVRPRQKAKV